MKVTVGGLDTDFTYEVNLGILDTNFTYEGYFWWIGH